MGEGQEVYEEEERDIEIGEEFELDNGGRSEVIELNSDGMDEDEEVSFDDQLDNNVDGLDGFAAIG